jgi:hypothetical protein
VYTIEHCLKHTKEKRWPNPFETNQYTIIYTPNLPPNALTPLKVSARVVTDTLVVKQLYTHISYL